MSANTDYPSFSYLFERFIQFSPLLREITGSVNASILLSSLLFESNGPAAKAYGGWIKKNHKELTQDTSLTRTEQKTARKLLVDRGFITERTSSVLPSKAKAPVKTTFFYVKRDVIDAHVKKVIASKQKSSAQVQSKADSDQFQAMLDSAFLQEVEFQQKRIFQSMPSSPANSTNGHQQPFEGQAASPANSTNGHQQPFEGQAASPANSTNGHQQPFEGQAASPANSTNGHQQPYTNGQQQPLESLQATNDKGCKLPLRSNNNNNKNKTISMSERLKNDQNEKAYQEQKPNCISLIIGKYKLDDLEQIYVESLINKYETKYENHSIHKLIDYIENGLKFRFDNKARLDTVGKGMDEVATAKKEYYLAVSQKQSNQANEIKAKTKKTYQSTAEELTDYQWANKFKFEDTSS